jgi:transposase
MAAPIPLRPDFDAFALRALARASRDANQARRLLALAEIYDGGSRSDAAKLGNVTLQIVRDWVLRFNADGPDALLDRWSLGPDRKLNADQRTTLAALVNNGPIPSVHGVVRWRLRDLAAWVWDTYRLSISPQTLSRELRSMNFRRLMPRPRHRDQAADAIPAFKKTIPTPSRTSAPACRATHR